MVHCDLKPENAMLLRAVDPMRRALGRAGCALGGLLEGCFLVGDSRRNSRTVRMQLMGESHGFSQMFLK